MKQSSFCALVGALTLAGAPAMAEVAPAPAPATRHSEVINVLLGMAKDFNVVSQSKENPIAKLDRLATFRYSPETAAAMIKVFGTDRPYTIVRVPAPAGKVGFRASVQPVAYLDPNGSRIEWAALDTLLTLDAPGRSMTMKGSWPSFTIAGKFINMSARGMSFEINQKRGIADLWFGRSQLTVPEVTFGGKGGPVDLTLHDTRISASVVQRGKLADINYKLSTASISAGGEQTGRFSLAARVVNLDAKALADTRDKIEKEVKGLPIEQHQAVGLPIIKEFMRQAVMHGCALIIDELRATYHANTATLKGRVGVDGRGEIALDASLVKRILAHFTVRVPIAMIHDGAGAIARKQVAASAPGQPVSEQAVAQMAQTITDAIVGQAIANGMARIENDYLLSDLEFRNGVMKVNGKDIALPKLSRGHAVPPAAAPAPVVPPPAAPAPAAAAAH